MKETQFKQTEIGLVPQEWRVVRLGEIGEPKMCKRIMKWQTSEIGDIPFFKIGTFGNIPDAFISRELFEEYKSRYSYPRNGDLLISAAGTIGRVIVYNGEDAYYQDSNIVWIDNDEKKAINRFLRYAYSNIEWETSTGTIPRLYNNNLKSVLIPLPPLSEQSRIAGALSSVDGLLSSLSRLIDKKRALRTAAMQQLLNAKTRLPGFNEPWKEVRLGDIMNIKSGDNITASSFVAGGSYPVYGGNGERGCYSLYNLDGRYILIGRVGALCGNIHLTNGKIWASEHCLICYPLSSYSEYFVGAILNRMNLIQYSNASAQPVIAANKLNEIQISLPSLPEQRAIASVLSSMDSELSALEAKRTKVEALRAGMMQQLLTGRIRLTEGDSERK